MASRLAIETTWARGASSADRTRVAGLEDQCLTIRPCSRRGGDVGSRTLKACLQGKRASRSTSPQRACQETIPVRRIWNPRCDLRSDPRRLVAKSNRSPPLDRRVSTPADSRGIDVSLLGAYGATCAAQTRGRGRPDEPGSACSRRESNALRFCLGGSAPEPRARAWVTYGFRSRRRCIHSAPGSPAPSRHSRAGWNRTSIHRAPKARVRPLDYGSRSGSPRLRSGLCRSSGGRFHQNS